ncbi:hypothetical protein MMAG44476_39215 [Mycolicibacterium mageritense DSM 44476 = CIP 104973]|uniref:Uncharacterized protein n=2 Tax=Mycolicibacterium TaxID=1866885 RepID=A0A117IA32_MYCCR|nr:MULTISPECIES: hypothetical protein [Mycolicibacterium]MCC9184589.1 hypothetical protein [Mycolicibacterium mageritense]MCV7212705.1 hypothetical protein [Mycolicibacterium canariasense]ORV09789.1 hypothetical protein AWB94_08810 [Mycolicibacterium canariasense]CDO25804.1 hypothetical protein BN978_06350 [Mycolicibacterium mageritense DSM 44476 = CIP 104973]BBX37530.1 hypothetical protein MMAGJ_68120 [Mycolicibacterium mageritense]
MSITALQHALDQYSVACWFDRLPSHERFWENRTGHEAVRLQARDRAIAAGASTDQLTDCDRYAAELIADHRSPLGLAGRSWDQFTADQRAQL